MNTSDEQQEVINIIKNGKNCIVDACAGSGKSTTILSCAEQIPNKSFLQLTYNATLRTEIKQKIKLMEFENITVHTFHSLAVRFYLPTAFTDSGIRKILHNNIAPKNPIPKYDIIVIDEAQDMTLLYYQFVIKFTRDMQTKFQILILGDYMQGLYEFKGADIRFLTLGKHIWEKHQSLISNHFEHCTLKISYRITNSMADFINTAMLGENRIQACKEGTPVTYIRRSRKQTETIVVNMVLNLLKDETIKPSDIFILGASVKGVKSYIRRIENVLVENNIPCHVPMIETEKMDDRVIDGKVVFSTFHSVKGRQRKYVFIVGFDNTYMDFFGKDLPKDKCPNTLYVGVTRGTTGLFLLESDQFTDDRPLEFLRMNHHEMIKSEFVHFNGIPRTLFYKKEEMETKSRKRKMHFVTPTELIKFIPESVLEDISPILDRIFVKDESFDLMPIEIPTIIKTKRGFYEDVSDLIGIAIPCMYYDVINNCRIINNNINLDEESNVLLDMINERTTDMLNNNDYAFLNDICNELPERCVTPQMYLYLANVYLAINEKIYSKLKQIDLDEYDWLEENIIYECKDRMDIVVGTEEIIDSEVTIIRSDAHEDHENIDNFLKDKFETDTYFRFTARVDTITEDSIWEIKCTSSIAVDHMLQVVIYAWLWNMTVDNDVKTFKIFNIKTGEILKLEASMDELNTIMLALLRGKYEKAEKITDEEFIDNCNKFM